MKRILLSFIACASLVLTAGCTKQILVKNWGGTLTETLVPNQKLVVMTWKDNDLWVLTRPMRTNETAETYTFKESSSWGMFQGTVTVVESKQ